jgi:ribosomal protein L35AE/L33A
LNSSQDLEGRLQGIIVNFRTGPKTQHSNECIVQFPSVRNANDAAKLIGRKIAWTVGKHTIRGKIVALHGKNGLVRTRFRKGLPGQIGVPVEITG